MAKAQSVTQAPHARGWHESIVLKDTVFIWGGRKRNGGYHSRLDLFGVNMATGIWEKHSVTPPDLPPPCDLACTAAIDNTIYSYGGQISRSPIKTSDKLYKLDMEEMRWRKVKGKRIKPEGRFGAGMCTVSGKLLLMGGYGPLPSESRKAHQTAQFKENKHYTGFGWNNELFVFDPHTGCWSPISVTGSEPSPRAHHTVTAIDEERAVLFGGFDGDERFSDLWSFDYEKMIWSYVTPSSLLWPEPRSSHTVCTVLCENSEIRVLLMGGHSGQSVLGDCWLLDVNQGTGAKLVLEGEPFKGAGHSAQCVKLLNKTVAISVFGGEQSFSLVSSPCFYQWDPKNPTVLRCGLPPAGTAVNPLGHIDPAARSDYHISTECVLSASDENNEPRQVKEKIIQVEMQQTQESSNMRQLVASKNQFSGEVGQSLKQLDEQEKEDTRKKSTQSSMSETLSAAAAGAEFSASDATLSLSTDTIKELQQLRKEVDRLTRRTEQQQGQIDQLNATLAQERYESENNIRQLIATNDQLNKDFRKANEDKQSQISSMDQIRSEKREMQQRLGEVEELLRTTEAARKTVERRLTDCQKVHNISFKDVRLSDMEVGRGSYGGVRVGYWCGCPVAVKILHKDLAKEQYHRRLFEQEVSVYSTLHHPNIAAICGVVQERGSPFCFIMELLQASLADVISSALASGKYLTIREQTDISHDCLSGLKYLHELPRPVLHGDIRPTNILLTLVMKAKLADLGAARFTDASLSVGPMSSAYIAPERLSGLIPHKNKESDVYSMGITLCELFTGDQKNQEDRPRLLGSVDHMDLRLLCSKMVCENAEKRVSASAALAINDRVFNKDEYTSCHPRRMVRGVMDGVQEVALCDKPW